MEARKLTQVEVTTFIVNVVYKTIVEMINCSLVAGLVFIGIVYS